jgi:hypothetical protein
VGAARFNSHLSFRPSWLAGLGWLRGSGVLSASCLRGMALACQINAFRRCYSEAMSFGIDTSGVPATADAGSYYVGRLATTGSPADTPLFSIVDGALPPGIPFDGRLFHSSVFQGFAFQAGVYPVTFGATDGVDSVTTSVVITITAHGGGTVDAQQHVTDDSIAPGSPIDISALAQCPNLSVIVTSLVAATGYVPGGRVVFEDSLDGFVADAEPVAVAHFGQTGPASGEPVAIAESAPVTRTWTAGDIPTLRWGQAGAKLRVRLVSMPHTTAFVADCKAHGCVRVS